MIRVIIAEGTPVIQKLFGHIMQTDPDILVVALASDGKEAIHAVNRHKPDILIINISLPSINGLEVIRHLMQESPLPIIVTGIDPGDSRPSMLALQYGAVSIFEIPAGPLVKNEVLAECRLVQTIRLMAEIKVVRRTKTATVVSAPAKTSSSAPTKYSQAKLHKAKIIAIGASTGGPQALEKIIPALPKDFSIPIVLVQHITSGFTKGFCEWLQSLSALPIVIACDKQQLQPGHCYLAPEDNHLEITKQLTVQLSKRQPEYGSRPAVSVMFRSLALEHPLDSVAILLSGMGKDGAVELGTFKKKGGITIAQSNDSCLIAGMPGEAIKAGSADYIFSPEEIADFLLMLNNFEKT